MARDHVHDHLGYLPPDLVQDIIAEYVGALAVPSKFGPVRDLRSLPHSKKRIKEAIKIALTAALDSTTRNQLRIAFLSLADFQPLTLSDQDALGLWVIGKGVSTATEKALTIQFRIADETTALVHELMAEGLWVCR